MLPLGLLMFFPPDPAVILGRIVATVAVLIVLASIVVFGSMTVSIQAGVRERMSVDFIPMGLLGASPDRLSSSR